ncbi:hypothetical protein PCH_Pc22g02260 [Penicillium rubens Wisconsin 54-1255]|uniref:Uncharacterized protein n=1 Tax=Penicillium rubens (strain ATCC 28089 / DSM 1075 / NRRL 1951 / Wisconsin 54-1255) TaxID=500485 RepID=B6HP86_PENRW|nr:hypothetical protein PCH_Pc22g02260 [Penicillium rubens Wisconsin 54-1255]
MDPQWAFGGAIRRRPGAVPSRPGPLHTTQPHSLVFVFGLVCSLDSAKPSRYEVQQLPVDPGHYGRKGHLHWKSLSTSFLLQTPGQAECLMKKEVASTGGSVSPVTQCNEAYASTEAKSQGPKIEITTVCSGQTPDGVGDLGKKGGGLLHLLSGKGKKKEEEDSGGDASLYTFSTLIDKVPTGSIALPESEMTLFHKFADPINSSYTLNNLTMSPTVHVISSTGNPRQARGFVCFQHHDRTTAMEPPNIALWGQRNKGLPHTKDPNGASNVIDITPGLQHKA